MSLFFRSEMVAWMPPGLGARVLPALHAPPLLVPPPVAFGARLVMLASSTVFSAQFDAPLLAAFNALGFRDAPDLLERTDVDATDPPLPVSAASPAISRTSSDFASGASVSGSVGRGFVVPLPRYATDLFERTDDNATDPPPSI